MVLHNDSSQSIDLTVEGIEYRFSPFETKKITLNKGEDVLLSVRTTAASHRASFLKDIYDITIVSEYIISRCDDSTHVAISWKNEQATRTVSFSCCFLDSSYCEIRIVRRYAESAEKTKKLYKRRWMRYYLFWKPVFWNFPMFFSTVIASIIIGLVVNVFVGLLAFAILYLLLNVGLGLLTSDLFDPASLKTVYMCSTPKFFNMSLEEDFIMHYYSVINQTYPDKSIYY